MKLREQASLGCKILALLCVVLALNSLQQSVPQAVGFMKMPGVSGQPTLMTIASMVVPATLMFLFAAALWGVSPFVAALMVPDEIVEKLDTSQETPSLMLSGRAAMQIALVILALWLLFRGAVSYGQVAAMSATVDAMKTAQDKVAISIFRQQINWTLGGAALELAFGVLLLILSRPISRRTFPN